MRTLVFLDENARIVASEMHNLRSNGFKDWLKSNSRREFNSKNLLEVIRHLENLAERDEIAERDETIQTVSMLQRSGYYWNEKDGDCFYLRLCNSSRNIFMVSASKYACYVGGVHHVFENISTVRQLPIQRSPSSPEEAKNCLAEFGNYLSTDEDGRRLALSFILTALYSRESINRPVLWVGGGNASDRKIACMLLKDVIDPHLEEPLSGMASEREFVSSYSSNVITCVNGVSSLTKKRIELYRRVSDCTVNKVVKTQDGAFSVSSTSNLILSSPNETPPSELSDKCFQVKINSDEGQTGR